jgi:hypothetical protein
LLGLHNGLLIDILLGLLAPCCRYCCPAAAFAGFAVLALPSAAFGCAATFTGFGAFAGAADAAFVLLPLLLLPLLCFAGSAALALPPTPAAPSSLEL